MPVIKNLIIDGMPMEEKKYREYLDSLNIFLLRTYGRSIGTENPAAKKKGELIDDIADILMGRKQPVERAKRGAPVKNEYVDPVIVDTVSQIRKLYHDYEILNKTMEVSAVEHKSYVYSGILIISNTGNGYIRGDLKKSTLSDVYVTVSEMKDYNLREGDYVVCTAEKKAGNSHPSILGIISVCEKSAMAERKNFDDFSPSYPEEKFSVGTDFCELKLFDLVCPIGKGQRALIASSKETDRYRFIEALTAGLSDEMKNTKIFVVLIDGRMEDSEEFSDKVKGATVISADFDMAPEEKVHIAETALKCAKNYAVGGFDSVVIIDSLTALEKAYEEAAYYSENAEKYYPISRIRKYFGAGRKLKEGGSLTMLAITHTDDNSGGKVYSELLGTENCRIILKDASAELPVPDIKNSFTLRGIYSDEERAVISKIKSAKSEAEALNFIRETENTD